KHGAKRYTIAEGNHRIRVWNKLRSGARIGHRDEVCLRRTTRQLQKARAARGTQENPRAGSSAGNEIRRGRRKGDYSAKGCRRRRDAIAARDQLPLRVHGNGDRGVSTTGRSSAGSSWYWQIQAQTAEIDLMEDIARHIAHDIIRERLESNTEADYIQRRVDGILVSRLAARVERRHARRRRTAREHTAGLTQAWKGIRRTVLIEINLLNANGNGHARQIRCCGLVRNKQAKTRNGGIATRRVSRLAIHSHRDETCLRRATRYRPKDAVACIA